MRWLFCPRGEPRSDNIGEKPLRGGCCSHAGNLGFVKGALFVPAMCTEHAVAQRAVADGASSSGGEQKSPKKAPTPGPARHIVERSALTVVIGSFASPSGAASPMVVYDSYSYQTPRVRNIPQTVTK
jgi:hypothetical protein